MFRILKAIFNYLYLRSSQTDHYRSGRCYLRSVKWRSFEAINGKCLDRQGNIVLETLSLYKGDIFDAKTIFSLKQPSTIQKGVAHV